MIFCEGVIMLRLVVLVFLAYVIVKIIGFILNRFKNSSPPLINLSQQKLRPELFVADEIHKLSRLLKDGVLTEAEFLNQKNKLLTQWDG